MWSLPIIQLLFCSSFVSCLLYIDRVKSNANLAIENLTVTFTHDATGNSVTTAVFTTFVTITKKLAYVKIRIAEDKNDKEFTKEIISTIVEIDKVFKGFQSNIFINNFFRDIRKSIDFRFVMPLPPVRINSA